MTLGRDLNTVRECWNEVTGEDRCSVEQLTIEWRFSIYLSLYRDMAAQIEETESAFRNVRECYLTELRARLRGLNVLRQQHGNQSEPA